MDLSEKIEKKELICLAGIFIFVFALLMDHTYVVAMDDSATLRSIGTYSKYLAYFLLCIKILWDQYDNRNLISAIVYMGIFVIAALFAGEFNFCLFFLIYVATIGCDGKRIISVSIFAQAIILIGSIVAALTGYVPNYDFSELTRKRMGMGFAWCTTAPIVFYFIALGYIYIRGRKFKWYEAVMLEVINYLIYTQTNTRMTFYVSTIFLLFFAIQSLWDNPWRIMHVFKWLWIMMPFICALISIGTTIMFDEDSTIWLKANAFLSGRLNLGFDAIKEYGFTLFGQPIEWIGSSTLNTSSVGYNYVDCSYLQIALNYGIIALIAILTIYSIAIYRACIADDYWLVFVLMFVLIHSLTEPRLYNFAFNTLSFVAFAKINCDRNKERERNDIIYNSGA